MTYVLCSVPEVEEDAVAAYAWYEEKAQGLGEEFLRAFYACTNEIARTPMISPVVRQEFRRRLLRRFPYAIYFRVENDEVVIFGLSTALDPLKLSRQSWMTGSENFG